MSSMGPWARCCTAAACSSTCATMSLNLTQPGLVQEVHEAYVQAGAEILETNTFGANPVKLSSHGLDDETEAINRTAVTHRPSGGQWPGPRRRSHRPAGHPAGALGTHRPGGSDRLLQPPGPGTAGGRGGRIHPRDLQRPARGGSRAVRRQGAERSPGHGPDDGGSRRQYQLRHDRRDHRIEAHRAGCRRRRAQLLGGAGSHARCARAVGGAHRSSAVGPAQCRIAPSGRRPPDLPRQPGIHGLLCQEDDPGGRPLRRAAAAVPPPITSGKSTTTSPACSPGASRWALSAVGPAGPAGSRGGSSRAALRVGPEAASRRAGDHG